MEHVIKFFLYLNTRHLNEFESSNKNSEIKQKLSKAKGKRIRSLQTNLMRASDVIYINNKQTDSNDLSVCHEPIGSKKIHFRRGHFKNVAHGKGRSLRKIKWIKPIIVNQSDIAQEHIKNKVYKVS